MHRFPDAQALGEGVARALADRLRSLAGTRADEDGPLEVAIAGGFVSTEVLTRVDPTGIPWPRIRVWWVDERFVAPGDALRNDSEAVRALFVRTPGVDLRPMPADTGQGLEAARQSFEREWTGEMEGRHLDLAVVGMGPDGHVASLFPGHAQVSQEGPVLAESDSPKPPPARLTLSLPVIAAATEVWVVAAGAAKADALARAFGGASPEEVPIAALRGDSTDAVTSWWVDGAAASRLPD